MSVKLVPWATPLARSKLLACLRQTFMVVLINIPTMSFGLAMGWVSLVTGESGDLDGSETSASDPGATAPPHVVAAAALTFCASLVGMPLCARALTTGRKPPLFATSVLFIVCWALKLCGGGWWLVAARTCAGLAGAGAWTLAPLLAREMCSARVRGAAVSALVLANNLGVLLMYLAAWLHVPHRVVLWSCLALSAAHCVVLLLMPESPQYLAAHGRLEEARESLAWLRGVAPDDASISTELAQFSTKEQNQHGSTLQLIKDMLSDEGRRGALRMSCVVVLAQELSGVLALLHYAERVFVAARGDADVSHTNVGHSDIYATPAARAVLLGSAQLVASALALYLVERLGRKKLLVGCALVTGGALAAAAGALLAGGGAAPWAAVALALAVFADSAGLEPAPYAMVADMFEYEYRSCAMAAVDALTWLGNALEVGLFPALVTHCGLSTTLTLSASLTLALAAYALFRVPETRGRRVADIYADILRRRPTPTTNYVVTHL